nr:hypothetical protein BaRGS_006544 [Batillaria attramentaria]
MAGLAQLTFLDMSNNQLQLDHNIYPPGVFSPLTSLHELRLIDNDDRLEGVYPNNVFTPLSRLQTMSIDTFSDTEFGDYFRAYAWRLFKNLESLETLDLSYNNFMNVDPHMLRAQRRLMKLNMAGNRLQSLSVDLEPHEDLELLDLSHNMLPTLLPHERQVLDTLAATHDVTLLLRDNSLLCACSNLDFVRWLWTTSVQLDGDGSSARNYTCVTDTGEVSDTHTVMMQYDFHWRRCVGQQVLGAVTAAFLLQMLALVIVYVVSRSWTHLRYAWKVMKRLRLPHREHFRRDAYVGYADADWVFACLMLPACLEERHGVSLLLRDREELPGSIRAESIVEHIDDSWKVMLLVTRDFARDEWACGFTVQQAQRSITDTMPDRVIVVFMEDPARLPPMASLERLLRMVPERNVMYVHKDTPPHDPQWDRLAMAITGGASIWPCTTEMHEDGLHVDCARRQLASLPFTWPDDVVWLDMSHNKLSGITRLSHLRLSRLRHLDLSHNQLHDTLANHTFAALHQLQWLSLHDNRLQGLQAGAMAGLGQLTFLDMSNNQLQLDHNTYPPGVFSPLTSLQELGLVGNDDRREGEYPDNVFTPLTSLRVLSIDTFSMTDFGSAFKGLSLKTLRLDKKCKIRNFFRKRAWRLFKDLKSLETLDLSYNNFIYVDPYMLRAQRHLKKLNMAGNRLQSLSVDLEPHEDLELLDLSHNMLPMLLPHERQALDTLAATNNFSLFLFGNPLLCACSDLDFVRWLWTTSIQLDGDGSSARNYTCVTDTGEVSDTHSVMMQYDFHWRRCVGQQVLGAVTAAFLLQMLALVIVYVVSRSWTHLRYAWKVMKRLRLPRREHFRRDAYVGYADADWEFACLMLPACLEERHGVSLLLRDREELPGSIRAESIVEHIDDSWKVLLLVTRDFARDEWACGFTVQQAQCSITDTMPDRVIVVFMEDPARLPPMASLERLLRMVPERNVMYVHKDTPPHDPQWDRLAMAITGGAAHRE